MKIRQRVVLEWGWADADASVKPVRIGDRLVPPVVEVHFAGVDGQPALDMRLEVVNGVPQCRELRFTSVAGGREVKGLDLGAVRLAQWVEDIFGMFASRIISDDGKTVTAVLAEGDEVDAAQAMNRARKGRAARKITPDLIRRVADVYAAHLDDAPTQAVKRAFGVEDRQARKYVKLAEEHGYLTEAVPGKIRRRTDGKH